MPKTETIQFKFKGYTLIAEYFYADDHTFHLVGIEFANPTQALMFLHEAMREDSSFFDNLERAIHDAVIQAEMDGVELERASKNANQWKV